MSGECAYVRRNFMRFEILIIPPPSLSLRHPRPAARDSGTHIPRILTFRENWVESFSLFLTPHPSFNSLYISTLSVKIIVNVINLQLCNNGPCVVRCVSKMLCPALPSPSRCPGVIYFPTLQLLPGPGLLCLEWVRVLDPFTKPGIIYIIYYYCHVIVSHKLLQWINMYVIPLFLVRYEAP